jgi:hypothetical protein
LSYKDQAWLGLALGHLLLVTSGASNVDFSKLGFIGSAIEYYGEVSGAGSGYGFFAPGIDGQLRVRFTLFDSSGKRSAFTWASPLVDKESSHEATIRLGNIIDQFPTGSLEEDLLEEPEDSSKSPNDNLKRSLAASLAASMFTHHPEVKQLEVYLEEYDPVSMKDFRRGLVSRWKLLYQARYKAPPADNFEGPPA